MDETLTYSLVAVVLVIAVGVAVFAVKGANDQPTPDDAIAVAEARERLAASRYAETQPGAPVAPKSRAPMVAWVSVLAVIGGILYAATKESPEVEAQRLQSELSSAQFAARVCDSATCDRYNAELAVAQRNMNRFLHR